MTANYLPEHLDRFLFTLGIVAKESRHLVKTRKRIFQNTIIDASWVENLENDDYGPDLVESFVSRFGRMQDTIADKLLPRLFRLEAEKSGSVIDNLNRAEHKRLIRSVNKWLTIIELRNKLVHEYMEEAQEFADSLNLTNVFTDELIWTYDQIQQHATQKLQIKIPF